LRSAREEQARPVCSRYGVSEFINLVFKSYRHLELVLADGSFQFSLWLVSHSGEEEGGETARVGIGLFIPRVSLYVEV